MIKIERVKRKNGVALDALGLDQHPRGALAPPMYFSVGWALSEGVGCWGKAPQVEGGVKTLGDCG